MPMVNIIQRGFTAITWQFLHGLVGIWALTLSPFAQAEGALWDAIASNDVGKAKTLIATGARVNEKNSFGNPLIHHAVSVGNAEIVELLIAKGADVNAKGRFERVALHYANKSGMAKILLAHGAKVDPPTNYGETPLHWSANGINSLGKGVNLVEFAETLIKHGADINKKTGEGRSYRTPLSYAAEANNLAVAMVLISSGADVEGGGLSPLGAAGANGDFVEMATLLVKHGARVNALSSTGWSPLMTAAGRGNANVVNFLLSQGADPNLADKAGFTALYAASGSNFGASSAEALLKRGADPNARTVHGLTALHQAASQGAVEVMKVLISHKADVNAKDNNGYPPMYSAIIVGGYRKGGFGVLEVLLNNGADVNSKTSSGVGQLLPTAIERNDPALVKFLLSYKPEIDDVARHWANRSREMSEIVRAYESDRTNRPPPTLAQPQDSGTPGKP